MRCLQLGNVFRRGAPAFFPGRVLEICLGPMRSRAVTTSDLCGHLIQASAMASYSQRAMPIIVLAMGCEMMYILHQRLGAQSVSSEKAAQVLKQVIGALVEQTLLDELFKPQDLYSVPSTKVIFEKIAHSSIMRLNSARYKPLDLRRKESNRLTNLRCAAL